MLDLFRHAGWVAWPLGFYSVLGLGIILERIFTLARLRRSEERAFTILLRALDTGDEAAVAVQRLRLRRYLGALATIGSTAPFIGLFGTVIGVLVAFQSMSQSG